MAEVINNPNLDSVQKIEGTDVLVFVDTTDGTADPTWAPFGCLTTNSLNKTRATIDATTKCGPDTRAGNATFELSFEGQFILDPPTGTATENDIDYWLKHKTQKRFMIGKAVPKNGDIRDRVTGIITQDNNTYAQNEMGTFSVTVAVQGTPTREVYNGTTWTEYTPA